MNGPPNSRRWARAPRAGDRVLRRGLPCVVDRVTATEVWLVKESRWGQGDVGRAMPLGEYQAEVERGEIVLSADVAAWPSPK